jgi:hypothetical protein
MVQEYMRSRAVAPSSSPLHGSKRPLSLLLAHGGVFANLGPSQGQKHIIVDFKMEVTKA